MWRSNNQKFFTLRRSFQVLDVAPKFGSPDARMTRHDRFRCLRVSVYILTSSMYIDFGSCTIRTRFYLYSLLHNLLVFIHDCVFHRHFIFAGVLFCWLLYFNISQFGVDYSLDFLTLRLFKLREFYLMVWLVGYVENCMVFKKCLICIMFLFACICFLDVKMDNLNGIVIYGVLNILVFCVKFYFEQLEGLKWAVDIVNWVFLINALSAFRIISSCIHLVSVTVHYRYVILVMPYSVLDLWENQRGVSNVFLTYFDYFFGGSMQT